MANSQSYKNIDDLLWLVDSWVNADGETVIHENWIKINDSLLEGSSETIKNGVTVFSEKLKILIKDNDIYYVADVKHNPAPVYFQLTNCSADTAVFENSGHDFPQKITYLLEEGTLHTFIEGRSASGKWKKVDFYYKRSR